MPELEYEFAKLLKLSGLRWERYTLPHQWYAVDYAGDAFDPLIFRLRIPLEHSDRTQEFSDVFWVDGRRSEYGNTLLDCASVIVVAGCRTVRSVFSYEGIRLSP